MAWEIRQGASDANGGGFRGGAVLSTPSTPTVTGSTSGGTIAANTYYVVVTLSDFQGETPGSPQASVTTTGVTSSITVTHPTDPASQGATWNVYVGTTSGGPYFSQGTGLAFSANRSITTTPPTTGTQPPGVDYSQQDSSQVAYTDLAIDGTTNTKATSAGNPFTAAHVGNVVNVTGGTGFTAQRAEIVGVASGVATFDKSLGTLSSTGGTGNLGGALASPGLLGALMASGNIGAVKYSATPYPGSASTNVAGGSISVGGSITATIFGYDTTRTVANTDANRPTFQASANSTTLITFGSSGGHSVANLILDGNGKTSVTGLTLPSTGDHARNLRLVACNVGVTVTGASATVEDSYATGCATSYNLQAASRVLRCTSVLATSIGIKLANIGAHAEDCIVYSTTGAGISLVNQPGLVTGCLVHTVTGDAIALGNSPAVIEGTIIYAATTGLNQSTGKKSLDRIRNCALGGNTTDVGSLTFAGQVSGTVTLAGDPCVNAAGGDFSLNNTAGAGAACRAAGLPGAFAGTATTGYRDIGPAQHADPATYYAY